MSENSLIDDPGTPWNAEEYAPEPAVLPEDPAEDEPVEPDVVAEEDRPIEDPERPAPEPIDEDDYAHEVP